MITNRSDRSDVPVAELKFYVIFLIFSFWFCFSLSSQQHWDVSQTKIRVISTLLFVLFGCLLFVALPAAIFKYIEGWSALESLYFVVITLTTIGFGDFVAGTETLTLIKSNRSVTSGVETLNISFSLGVRWVRYRVLGLL